MSLAPSTALLSTPLAGSGRRWAEIDGATIRFDHAGMSPALSTTARIRDRVIGR